MKITENYCTNNNRYKAAKSFKPTGVVLHSIGTPQPKASALVNYWQNNPDTYATHYVLDDTVIYNTIPENYLCYHVGSPGNGKYIGIEMCEPKQLTYISGARFTVSNLSEAKKHAEACYRNAVWLIAELCKKYDWDPEKAVWTHYEITTKKMSSTDHVDPQHLWDGLGMGYDLTVLRKDVAEAMGQKTAEDSPTASSQIYRIRKSWDNAKSQIGAYKNLEYAKAACKPGYQVYDESGTQVYPEAAFKSYLIRVTASSLNVRTGAGMNYSVVMTLPRGGAYTIVQEKDGWGKLKSGVGWISLKYTEKIK